MNVYLYNYGNQKLKVFAVYRLWNLRKPKFMLIPWATPMFLEATTTDIDMLLQV